MWIKTSSELSKASDDTHSHQSYNVKSVITSKGRKVGMKEELKEGRTDENIDEIFNIIGRSDKFQSQLVGGGGMGVDSECTTVRHHMCCSLQPKALGMGVDSEDIICIVPCSPRHWVYGLCKIPQYIPFTTCHHNVKTNTNTNPTTKPSQISHTCTSMHA